MQLSQSFQAIQGDNPKIVTTSRGYRGRGPTPTLVCLAGNVVWYSLEKPAPRFGTAGTLLVLTNRIAVHIVPFGSIAVA